VSVIAQLRTGSDGISGTDFVCFRCGTCCRKYQPQINFTEARLIVDQLGISWEEWLSSYADPRWPGEDSFLIRQKDGACIFLEQISAVLTRCAIYNVRPAACLEWQPGLFRSECRRGLLRYWHLEVDSSGRLTGPSEDLTAFEIFLKSLDLTF